MLIKVKEWIAQHKILANGDKILVACSGGPDSLALLHIFSRLCLDYNITIFAAHVDHMFRGSESAQEANFVVDFCRERGIVCYHTAIDVPKIIRESHLSGQDASRVLRYQYLRKIAQELGGAKIATGHHRDDQAETVLINLLRGAGSVGIGGIQPINGELIRPLLSVTRAEIMEYCKENQLEPRFDSSNFKTTYLRNRIRIHLLPELEKQYNPGIKDALCRTATIVGDEHEFIKNTAQEWWPKVATEKDQHLFIDAKKMKVVHIAVQREIFRMAIEKKQGYLKGISFHHVETLVELLATGRVGSNIQLPNGLLACKSYDGLYLGMGDVTLRPSIDYEGQVVVVPGTTLIPELGIMLVSELLDEKKQNSEASYGIFDWAALTQPLLVRTRRAGDKFQPIGFHGTKKLKDFFIDEKIPREERDYLPIIFDRHHMIWVGGYRQSEIGKVTMKTEKFLHIKIVKLQQKNN